MIGNPIDKRRAERYSELLEAAQGGRRRHRRSVHDDELAPLLEVGEALHQTALQTRDASAPRPEFQAALRQRLMAVAAAQGIGTAAQKPSKELEVSARRTHRYVPGRRRMVVASALAVGVLGLSGVSSASGDAMPGDTLYPVKRSAERAQLALAGSEANRGQLFFEFARTRLDEAGQVIDNPEALSTALAAMDSQFASGMKSLTSAAVNRHDAAVLDTIDAFLDGQSPKLAELLDEAPGAAHNNVGESMDLMDSAAERSQELREALLCSASFDEDSDRLGPLPGECGVIPGSGGTPLDMPTQDPPAPTPDSEDGTVGPQESTSQPDAGTPSTQPNEPSDTPPTKTPPPAKEDGDGLLGEIGDTLDDLLG